MKNLIPIFGLIMISILFSCSKDNPEDTDVNIFSIQEDKKIGKQLDEEIESMPNEYPILDRNNYPLAYDIVEGIRDSILNSGKVFYKDEFVWEIHIINDDSVLNAFAAPGGYIYIYTGLIKFLNAEHELAGVMAHEIAHADRRHTTDQLTKIYGIQLLFDVVLGNDQNTLSDIALNLSALSFSRSNEEEADEYSVIYLCPTTYMADGAAAFFDELQKSGAQSPPEFLSTHPNPGDRVQAIRNKEDQLGCTGNNTYDQRYQRLKSSLP